METLVQKLELSQPMIVSPSLSGGVALPYLLEKPESAHHICCGFVPVAPVATGHYSKDVYSMCQVCVFRTLLKTSNITLLILAIHI